MLQSFQSQAQMMMLMNGDFTNNRRACFTENYLVFSLNERMPQITEIYLDKEDDVLDYCKRIIFNPGGLSRLKDKLDEEYVDLGQEAEELRKEEQPMEFDVDSEEEE